MPKDKALLFKAYGPLLIIMIFKEKNKILFTGETNFIEIIY